jgi:DNA-directed RNA polymerase subunit RPC12/RpoP
MKTLSEYDKEYHERRNYTKSSEYSTGIACDKCKHELSFTSPNLVLMSSPPQKNVECPNCGFKGYMYV